MSTQHSQPASRNHRVANREELTRFYAAIGIPAVISAIQASKMQLGSRADSNDAPKKEFPAFLNELQPVS
jgi:hypothetical protein